MDVELGLDVDPTYEGALDDCGCPGPSDAMPADPTAGDLGAGPAVEFIDGDGDGHTEAQLVDLNNDGVDDLVGLDTNFDDIVDTVAVDETGDGEADFIAVDENQDGEADQILPADTPMEELPAVDLRPHFDPATATEVTGDQTADLENWHLQESGTCAVVSQEFILESLTGEEFTEAELVAEATERGWYSEEGGTTMENMGKILELHGVGVERTFDNSYEDLVSTLESGEKVMVALDSQEIWGAGTHAEDDAGWDYANGYGVPGSDANHAVQIVGIDTSDPNNPMVIINDSGIPGGQGAMVPVAEFMDAWEDAGHYMVATTGEPPAAPPDELYARAA